MRQPNLNTFEFKVKVTGSWSKSPLLFDFVLNYHQFKTKNGDTNLKSEPRLDAAYPPFWSSGRPLRPQSGVRHKQ